MRWKMADKQPLLQEALHHAVCSGDSIKAVKLLQAGCLPDEPCRHDKPWERHAVHTAAYHGHLDVVTALIEDYCVDVNTRDSQGHTPVYWAMVGGKVHVVKYLIHKGADLHITYDHGTSVLHVATWSGHNDICHLLCEEGIGINWPDEEKVTPLHDAVSQKRLDLVELYVEYGADINFQTCNGRSALHLAVISNDIGRNSIDENSDPDIERKIVKKLLEAGACTEIKDSQGHTALLVALLERNVEMCKILLHWGADIDVCDTYGTSVFTLALLTDSKDLVKLVLDSGCCMHKEWWIPAKMWPYQILCSLELCDRVTHLWQSVWRLNHLCRCVIRHLLKSRKRQKAAKLPLPHLLQDFVSG